MTRTMRSEVAHSWHRSAAAGVAVDADSSAITVPSDDLSEVRDAHPLSRVYPLLEDVLGHAARSCDALLALSDESGQLLWVTGSNETLRKAERIGFVEGSNWDERVAGTNAPGLALTLDRPAMVWGEEHYRELVKAWNCVATPIHDPTSGAVIGVLDITGGPAVAVPQTVAMVQAAARLAESELARLTPGLLWGVAGQTTSRVLALEVLGRRRGLLTMRGRAVELSLRHTEMLVALAQAPLGLSGDELAVQVYEQEVNASTLRAEVNRLRSLVGEDVIGSRPYRLNVDLAADWDAVRAGLSSGDAVAAVRAYRGPILPNSQAPAVAALRDQVEAEMRHAVLSSGRVDLMAAWTRTSWGVDDHSVWTAQQALLPAGSPLEPLVRSQMERLDRQLGVD